MITQQRPASEKCININGGTRLFHVPPSDIVVFLWYYYIQASHPPACSFLSCVYLKSYLGLPSLRLHRILDSSLVPYQVGPHTARRSADHASRGKMRVAALKGGL